MLELTKEQITDGFAEYRFRVPVEQAKEVEGAVRAVLGLVHIEDNDNVLCPIEDLIGELTPANAVKGLRIKEGLTQAALAEKLGTRQTYISAIENGKSPVSRAMAQKIEALFGVSYKSFL